MINLIREEEYPLVMRDIVEPVLSEIREDVYIDVKGGKYHAEVYENENAERAIVIVHGYTESAEKFREMTWYLLDAGFSVFAIDHRGHAQSLRQVADTSITHVDRFDDYVDDLDAFIEQIVLPRTKGLPLCILGHSMGGAVTALEIMRHPDRFARAVLNAPMIAAVSEPFPRRGAAMMGALMCLLGKAKERAFVGKPFDPEREKFETSHMTSRARFDYYQQKRNARKELQNCSPSYSWVREGMSVTDRLLKTKNTDRIKTPVLLCQAARDSIVCLPQQNQFVEQVAGAQLVSFDAKHEIYSSEDSVLKEYYNTVIGFLKG
ncbi:MAG: alpha/beta hydrolase [Clostridia bacterium]|nr:alpha/beta hydrolase [Clostridia bacterium]